MQLFKQFNLHSVWDEHQAFHLIRYLEVTSPWDAGSAPTGSGMSTLEGLLPEVLCVNKIFPCDFKPFWICHRRIVTSLLRQCLKGGLLFSDFISFSYKVDHILNLLNFKRCEFILIYSVVLMRIDKMTGQKVRNAVFPSLFHARQSDLGSGLSQDLDMTFSV